MIDLRAKPFFLNDEDIAWVEKTIARMTEVEKIGQLFVPIGYSGDPEYLDNALLSYHIGGVLYRSGLAEEMRETHRYLQMKSKIPLLISSNLEAGGNGAALEGTYYGQQMQVGATNNPENAYNLGKIACREGRAVGINWAFAPVVDIDMNWRNPITNNRTYGSDPALVLACGKKYMQAAHEENVAVSIKHFPGDGWDEVDQHILTSVNGLSCEEWDATFGTVYQGLIDAGAMTVMAGHIAMPAYQKHFNADFPAELIPASLSPELLGGLLRGKLGFNGLIVTDSTCMVGFSAAMAREQAVPYSIEAGCDMFLFNKDLPEDFAFMLNGYRKGLLSERRLREALQRILATKASLGLHRKPKVRIVPEPDALEIVGCDDHARLARDCAEQSVTLVKDTQHLLPLDPLKHRRVLLEILGDFPSSPRIQETMRTLLEANGFKVEIYVPENFDNAKFDVTSFRARYDLVFYVANIENTSNMVTNRLSWHTFWGNGNNVPWFVRERPVLFASVANPYHLVDVPMIKTYINCYGNSDFTLSALMEKVMGRQAFCGKSPIDPFCGKDYLAY